MVLSIKSFPLQYPFAFLQGSSSVMNALLFFLSFPHNALPPRQPFWQLTSKRTHLRLPDNSTRQRSQAGICRLLFLTSLAFVQHSHETRPPHHGNRPASMNRFTWKSTNCSSSYHFHVAAKKSGGGKSKSAQLPDYAIQACRYQKTAPNREVEGLGNPSAAFQTEAGYETPCHFFSFFTQGEERGSRVGAVPKHDLTLTSWHSSTERTRAAIEAQPQLPADSNTLVLWPAYWTMMLYTNTKCPKLK